MMRFAPLALVLLLAAAPGDQLPLTQGIFVIAATPCKGAPNSDIMSYWGGNNALNVAQAECTIRRASHAGSTWTIARHCASVQGDDLGTDTIKLTIASPKAFTLDGNRYRWCGRKVQF